MYLRISRKNSIAGRRHKEERRDRRTRPATDGIPEYIGTPNFYSLIRPILPVSQKHPVIYQLGIRLKRRTSRSDTLVISCCAIAGIVNEILRGNAGRIYLLGPRVAIGVLINVLLSIFQRAAIFRQAYAGTFFLGSEVRREIDAEQEARQRRKYF